MSDTAVRVSGGDRHATDRVRGLVVAASCLAVLCGSFACADDKPATPQVPPPVAPSVASKNPVTPVPAQARPTPAAPSPLVTMARVAAVTNLEGTQREPSLNLKPGQRLDGGALIALAAKQSTALDIAQSGRLDVQGEARLRLGLDAEAQVLAAHGLLTVKMPPTGDGKLLPMRLATPRLTLVLRPGTVAVVAIARSHDVLVHVLSGEAEIAPSGVDGEVASEVERINPGAAKRFDSRGITPLKPGEDVASALSKATAFLGAAGARARPSSGTANETGAVEAALARFEEEVARGRELGVQQQAAVAAGDKAARQARQRDLAEHGQRLFRLRRVLLTLWERAQLAHLAAPSTDGDQSDDTLRTLRARLAPVLPR